MRSEFNRVSRMYDQKSKAATELEGENRHLQEHMNGLKGQNSELEEKLEVVSVEKVCMDDHIRHLEDEKIKNEKLHETTASMNRELKNHIQEVTAEKELILSKLHAKDQQRKHDYAEWQTDRTTLERAITDISRLADENMSLTQQLKHTKAQKLQAENATASLSDENAKLAQQLNDAYSQAKKAENDTRLWKEYADDQHKILVRGKK